MGLFGGNTDASKAVSQAQAAINSSGWVIGSGNAGGGALSGSSSLTDSAGFKWYQWLALAVVGVVLVKKLRGK